MSEPNIHLKGMIRHFLMSLAFVSVLGSASAGRILPNLPSARFADASQAGFIEIASGLMKEEAAKSGFVCVGPVEVYGYNNPAAITAEVNRWLFQRGYRATALGQTPDQANWKAEGPNTLFGVYGRIGERASRDGALMLCRAKQR